jgi:hypothetical protein
MFSSINVTPSPEQAELSLDFIIADFIHVELLLTVIPFVAASVC